MAEVFHVICNVQETAGSPGGGGNGELTVAQQEEITGDKRFTEAVKVLGNFQVAKIVTIEAASAIAAARFCKYVLKLPVTGVAALKAAQMTNAEAAAKPTPTVKTTGYETPTIS